MGNQLLFGDESVSRRNIFVLIGFGSMMNKLCLVNLFGDGEPFLVW